MKNLKMFSTGLKGNQRYNGLASNNAEKNGKSKTLSHSNYIKIINPVGSKDNYNNIRHGDVKYVKNSPMLYSTISPHGISYNDVKVKVEPDEPDVEDKITAHSIIGVGDDVLKAHKPPTLVKQRFKQGIIRATHHETLQRIDVEEDIDNIYQQHWFSASIEKFKLEDRSREERIEITRHELRRYLQQLLRSQVGTPNKLPAASSSSASPSRRQLQMARSKYLFGYDRLVGPKACEAEACRLPALPCTRHCARHIMQNSEQVLFDFCTAKFADNTQCSVPVFDITHELPLCPEHARKRDNYKLNQETRPKKLRKKVKPSAMIRPQKRSKKKKKSSRPAETTTHSAIINVHVAEEDIKEDNPALEADMQMVDHVLGLDQPDVLEQELETQAHLLEETDISNVLSTIQVDEFSDFFAVSRNGEYEEPSREEAEELEKALAAVDNDVKSLEKLSQTHGLLDSLLDEHTLTDSLVQIPDVFHNGYPPCGDSMVAQTSSFLLPVEPHSHS